MDFSSRRPRETKAGRLAVPSGGQRVGRTADETFDQRLRARRQWKSEEASEQKGDDGW